MQLYELARRNYVSRKKINDLTPDDLSSTNLLNYFAPTAQNSIQLVQDAERIRELAPEIVQAETVMVSATMAPSVSRQPSLILQLAELLIYDQNSKIRFVNILKITL